MYTRVLVPIDGSQAAATGLDEAIKLCQNTTATLRLIHVVNEIVVASPFVAGTFDPLVFSTQMVDRLREDARELLARAEARVRQHGLQVTSELVEALGRSAGDEILRHAREWPADLIVMGTHGRRGLRRVLLGSDAELVVRSAPVPVLLVRSPDEVKSTPKGSRAGHSAEH